jgi:hypothetical protein
MARLNDANGFKQEKIDMLKKETFDQLARRPSREELIAPPELDGLNIFVYRKPGENGGVQISVSVEKRIGAVFVAALEDGFEIFSDGRIVPFDTEHDDDED